MDSVAECVCCQSIDVIKATALSRSRRGQNGRAAADSGCSARWRAAAAAFRA